MSKKDIIKAVEKGAANLPEKAADRMVKFVNDNYKEYAKRRNLNEKKFFTALCEDIEKNGQFGMGVFNRVGNTMTGEIIHDENNIPDFNSMKKAELVEYIIDNVDSDKIEEVLKDYEDDVQLSDLTVNKLKKEFINE